MSSCRNGTATSIQYVLQICSHVAKLQRPTETTCAIYTYVAFPPRMQTQTRKTRTNLLTRNTTISAQCLCDSVLRTLPCPLPPLQSQPASPMYTLQCTAIGTLIQTSYTIKHYMSFSHLCYISDNLINLHILNLTLGGHSKYRSVNNAGYLQTEQPQFN